MKERKQGHSALRAKDGKIETFDPHPVKQLKHDDPPGLNFYDNKSCRQMRYVYPDTPHVAAGWILFLHPDGQWVTLRKATAADIGAMSAAVIEAYRKGTDGY